MKKLILIAALAVFALNASAAGGYKSSKPLDNTYVTLQGGVYEPFAGQNILKDARPVIRLSVNKFFNTVVGASIWAQTYINNNNYNNYTAYPFYDFSYLTGQGNKTMFDGLNIGVNGLVNLNNLFAGYAGAPRFFEVIAEAGVGYFHQFGAQKWDASTGKLVNVSSNWRNVAHSTIDFALDFNFNLNEKLQLGIRPEVQFLENVSHWGRQTAQVQLTAGIAYNLGGVFTPIVPRDQAEIDALNGKINDLRSELDAKDRMIAGLNKTINDLKAELAKKPVVAPAAAPVKVALQPSVIFRQGKSVIDANEFAEIEMVAKYMKNHPDANILIEGYASPEGPADLNQKLSEKRAEVVKNTLIKKYGIAAERLEAKGMGITDKLFDEYDFNRVAMFIVK